MNRNEAYSTLYRTDGLSGGALRRLGTMHLHVDGGEKIDDVFNLVKSLEKQDVPGKITAVIKSTPGPQRVDHPATYASHTPGKPDCEELEYFSTSKMTDRAATVVLLKQILPGLGRFSGAVVEVERVIVTIEDGIANQVAFEEMAPIESREVGFVKATTLPFEVHHAIDIRSEKEPVNLKKLLCETAALGVVVGGWFIFQKEYGWSYRSNSFWSLPGLYDRAMEDHRTLNSYLLKGGIGFRMWTIIEQVIGIWKAPFTALPEASE